MNHNIAKGLLILLVIIDHNDFARDVIPGFLRGLSFHVVAFMALPFIRPATPLTGATVVRHFFRLYYPFMVFTGAVAAAYWINTDRAFVDMLAKLIHALYSANAVSLKAATNMALLWFLPSLFSLLIIRGLIESTVPPLGRFIGIAALLCHPFIGAVSGSVQHYLPLGLVPAMYVVPLVYAIAILQLRVFNPMDRTVALAASAVFFVLVKTVQMQQGLTQEVGFGLVSDYRDPLDLLLNDLEAISGSLFVFQMARFDLGNIWERVGRFSLQAYLFHAFIGSTLFFIVMRIPIPLNALAAFVVTVSLTLAGSLILAQFVHGRKRLKPVLFPEHWVELLGWMGRLSR